jgi:hypothetical protein
MKKSSKFWSTVMIDGMFMNSNSSTESSLEEDKYRLSTANLIFLDDEEQIINKCSSSRNSLTNNKDLIRSNRESTWMNNGIEHWRTNLRMEKIG